MAKTAEEIFKMAAALIYENATGNNSDAESRAFTPDFLNIHLQECLNAENSIRRSLGETELTSAPWITDLATSIDYHDALTRVALPYACASHYYAESMNEERAMSFENEYKKARSNASVCVEEDITDVYASEE